MRKSDEIELFRRLRAGEFTVHYEVHGIACTAAHPQDAGRVLDIHPKRVCAILRKWEDRRWWNGTSSGLTGNFEPGAPEVLAC